MKQDVFFHGQSGRWIVALGSLSVGIVLFYAVFGSDHHGVNSYDADAFSRSAIGHGALIEYLTGAGDLRVLLSRHESAGRVGPGQVLFILEPPSGADALKALREMIVDARSRGAQVLVVLPKWLGRQGDIPGWVDQVSLKRQGELDKVLAAVAAGVVGRKTVPSVGWQVAERTRSSADWTGPSADLELDLPVPQLLRRTGDSAAPFQVHASSTAGDLLLSFGDDANVWLLSDPDLINTAGLIRGDNAAMVDRMLELLDVDAVVVDETLHGYARRPSRWRALVEMPLLSMTLHGGLLLCLAVWAGATRFGKPLPEPTRLPAGKLTLVENTAGLLRLGGDRRNSLQAYLELKARRCAAFFGLEVPGDELVSRLDRLAEARGISGRLGPLAAVLKDLPTDVEAAKALRVARDISDFHKELTDDDRC